MLVRFEPGLGSWKVILSHTDLGSRSAHAHQRVDVELVGNRWNAFFQQLVSDELEVARVRRRDDRTAHERTMTSLLEVPRRSPAETRGDETLGRAAAYADAASTGAEPVRMAAAAECRPDAATTPP